MVPALKEALAYFDARLAPVTAEEFMVIIEPVFKFGEAWGIPMPQVATQARFLLDCLGELPDFLLEAAVRKGIAQHKSWSRLPLPAELYEQVGEDYARINTERYRFRTAIGMAENAAR